MLQNPFELVSASTIGRAWTIAERAHVAPAGRIEATCIDIESGIFTSNDSSGTDTKSAYPFLAMSSVGHTITLSPNTNPYSSGLDSGPKDSTTPDTSYPGK